MSFAEPVFKFDENALVQGAIDAIPTPVYFRDTNRICLRCNKAFASLLGLAKEKIIDHDIDAVIFADSLEATVLLDDVLLSLESEQSFETSIRGACGSVAAVSVYRTVYQDSRYGRCIATAIIDITARKQAEKAINRALTILNGVLEASNEGFLAIQRVHNENMVVASNQKLFDLFRLPKWLAGNFSELRQLADKVVVPADFWESFVARCADTENSYHGMVETADGKILEEYSMPFYGGLEVVGRVWSYRDITEKRLAEIQLNESNERNQALWYQSSDGIFVFDPESLQIQEANVKLLAMLGYTGEELLKLTQITLSDMDGLRSHIRHILNAGSHYFGPIKLRKANGHLLHAEVTAAVISYQQKQVILVTARDISERVRLEDQIMSDVYLAAKAQRQFLPEAIANDWITVKGIYEPQYQISGDIYHFYWDKNRLILSGFLLDVSGHGIATALTTSVILPLAKKAMDEPVPLNERVALFNQQSQAWFNAETYAAGIFFELDVRGRQLSYVPAGIGCFLYKNADAARMIKAPGFLLGLFPQAEYDLLTLSVEVGDSICFVSDGISDLLQDKQPGRYLQGDFPVCFAFLEQLATGQARADDASAVCIYVGKQ